MLGTINNYKMAIKRSNLSLHKTNFHKSIIDEINEDVFFLEFISDALLIENQIENSEEFVLYDIDAEEEVVRFEKIADVLFDDYPIHSLTCTGVSPFSLLSLKIPSSMVNLVLDGGDYFNNVMIQDEINFKLFEELKATAIDSRFVTDDVVAFELLKNQKIIYGKIQELNIRTYIDELLFKLKETNINEFGICKMPLSIVDFEGLECLTNLESLELVFNIHNSEIIKLPPNLKSFALFGAQLDAIPEVVLSQSYLENLDLSFNWIKYISVNKLWICK